MYVSNQKKTQGPFNFQNTCSVQNTQVYYGFKFKERAINKNDKTNNCAEATSRRVNIQMVVTHPTISAFITCLRKIQSSRDTYYCQLEAGKSLPKKTKIQQYVAKQIFKKIL